jgi:hypothetical protein
MKLPKLDKIGLSASFKGGVLFSKIIKNCFNSKNL